MQATNITLQLTDACIAKHRSHRHVRLLFHVVSEVVDKDAALIVIDVRVSLIDEKVVDEK